MIVDSEILMMKNEMCSFAPISYFVLGYPKGLGAKAFMMELSNNLLR